MMANLRPCAKEMPLQVIKEGTVGSGGGASTVLTTTFRRVDLGKNGSLPLPGSSRNSDLGAPAGTIGDGALLSAPRLTGTRMLATSRMTDDLRIRCMGGGISSTDVWV